MISTASISTLVLIPVYNGERHLLQLIPRLRKYVCDSNLLFVNDGSTDGTARILAESGVNHLTQSPNAGKGVALMTGYRYAIERGYRSVLSLDCDLQHLPEEVPRFFARDNGQRVLIGKRDRAGTNMPPHRRLSNFLTSLLISIICCRRIRDSQCGFRLIPTALLREIPTRAAGYDYESEFLFKLGATAWRSEDIPVSTVYGEETSYVHPVLDTVRFIKRMWQRVWM
jgi:glycosyltransferase involved in cell wall biosynthesis